MAALIVSGVSFMPQAQAASASQTTGQQNHDRSGPGRFHHVETSCQRDYQKLIANPVAGADGRAMAFALKFRTTDLSLQCRHAVEALTKKNDNDDSQ